jgi:hypothetical protein
MAKILVDRAVLTALVRQPAGSLDSDAYTTFWAEAADDLVKTTAEHPEWVGELSDPPEEGEVLAPLRARNIAAIVAKRAWMDADNLQRRTSGPISDTFFESDLHALELTDDERSYLQGQAPSGRSTGLWVQPVGNSQSSQAVYLPDSWPGADSVYMDDGSYPPAYGSV